jgi:hypothetical protein
VQAKIPFWVFIQGSYFGALGLSCLLFGVAAGAPIPFAHGKNASCEALHATAKNFSAATTHLKARISLTTPFLILIQLLQLRSHVHDDARRRY